MVMFKQLLPFVPHIAELISVDTHQLSEGKEYQKCPQWLHKIIPVVR